MRFVRQQVRLAHQPRVETRAETKHAQERFRARSQGVVDGLDESGQIIGGVAIDEQDLVVRVGQYFGDAVDADGRALVEIVTVRVVAAVEYDGNHFPPACRSLARPLNTVSFNSKSANPQFA